MTYARRYVFTQAEAAMFHRLVKDHIAALHNWGASAIEAGEIDRARELVKELREYEALYAKTNVEAHKMIDADHEARVRKSYEGSGTAVFKLPARPGSLTMNESE